MRRSWVPGAAAGIVLLAGGVALAAGAAGWRRAGARAVADLRDPLRSGAANFAGARRTADAAGALPAPVARYFAFALPAGGPRVSTARIHWSGEFRSRPGGGWSPFTAVQHFTTAPPGFVWDAEIQMVPLVPVCVRDGYRDGEATMLGRIGGIIPVVDQGGSPEIAQSALARWLGEAVWFPTALLPGEAVSWEPVSDQTARVTLRDGGVSVSAEFHFSPSGSVTRMTTMRYRDVKGRAVLTAFEGRYGGYVRRSGMMVPESAEVAWLLPEGRFAYWRGRPADIRYELTSAEPEADSP